jgi:hypothetical protein
VNVHGDCFDLLSIAIFSLLDQLPVWLLADVSCIMFIKLSPHYCIYCVCDRRYNHSATLWRTSQIIAAHITYIYLADVGYCLTITCSPFYLTVSFLHLPVPPLVSPVETMTWSLYVPVLEDSRVPETPSSSILQGLVVR